MIGTHESTVLGAGGCMGKLGWSERYRGPHRSGVSNQRRKRETVCRINKSIHFPNEDPALRLTLPLPQLPYQVAYLANALLPYSESAEFQPCLVWMTDRGIWSEVSERVAKSLAECFRSTRGKQNPPFDTPAGRT